MPQPVESNEKHIVTPQHFLAVFFGWMLPGLGHYVIGQRRRAGLLAASIGGLWLIGVLIGGVAVIDNRSSTEAGSKIQLWFFGQMLVGPSVAVHFIRGNILHRQNNPTDPASFLTYEPSYGRVYEHGVLLTALAGLLNLLACIDVLYRPIDQMNRNSPLTHAPVGKRT